MTRFISCLICLLAFAASICAQTSETFDIASFRAPNGWQRQTKEGAVIFTTTNQQQGTYAMLVLYRSSTSSGNANTDFAADWQQFIVTQLGVKEKPQLEPAKKVQGWDVVIGGSPFQNEQGASIVILNTYSGFGKSFSFAVVFNSQDYVPAVEAFITSITLSKPATSSQTTVSTENSILGSWGMSSGVTQSYGLNSPYSATGYSKAQYTFNNNGTYTFVAKTFGMSYDKIVLVKESGSFQINGNNITISPAQSVVEAWSKRDGADKWGRLLSTQKRPLEKVTYRFTKHYFSGIQEWNLVLQADRVTERDGPFSSNTTFPNAWYYSPISSSNPLIELPG